MEDWKEFSGKTVDEAIEAGLAELNTTRDNVNIEVVEEGSSGFLGFNKKPAIVKLQKKETVVEHTPAPAAVETAAAPAKDVNAEEIVKKFILDVLGAMGVEATVEAVNNAETETLEVQIIGDDMGILIGKRGQTLDSLQYLASLAVTKETQKYVKVKLDTENYRERRKETLENLAKNIAMKVKKSHKSVALEPMNPYERRIIHSALQADKFVETHSEGEEPYRKVIVTPKKGMNYEDRRRGGRYGNNRRYDSRNGGTKKVSSSREFHKKYGAETKDYSTDYKKDYADYLESKAAAKAAAEAQAKSENN